MGGRPWDQQGAQNRAPTSPCAVGACCLASGCRVSVRPAGQGQFSLSRECQPIPGSLALPPPKLAFVGAQAARRMRLVRRRRKKRKRRGSGLCLGVWSCSWHLARCTGLCPHLPGLGAPCGALQPLPPSPSAQTLPGLLLLLPAQLSSHGTKRNARPLSL